jgi:hypothetical protein
VLVPQLHVGRDCIIQEGARSECRARTVRLICSLLIGKPVGTGAIFGRDRSWDGKPDAVIASGFIFQALRRARDIPMTSNSDYSIPRIFSQHWSHFGYNKYCKEEKNYIVSLRRNSSPMPPRHQYASEYKGLPFQFPRPATESSLQPVICKTFFSNKSAPSKLVSSQRELLPLLPRSKS